MVVRCLSTRRKQARKPYLVNAILQFFIKVLQFTTILFALSDPSSYVVTSVSRNRTVATYTTTNFANITNLTPGYNFSVTVEAYVNNATLVGTAVLSTWRTGMIIK